jgi:predicted metal-dependent phosphoesterase TrpH
MHTTASDGQDAPEALVERAWRAGIRTLSVTDHDTLASVEPATRAAERRGMTVIPGIEITSIHDGRDVHVLAYFVSTLTPNLMPLLTRQRKLRVERAVEIAHRLSALGAPIDADALVQEANAPGGRSLARPQIAQALITAGHVSSVAEAFERYLNDDGPAYVPHRGASPAEVVDVIVGGGGVASLAHPGYRPRDEIIPALVNAGLGAIEVFHSSHDEAAQAHYLHLAERFGVGVTGGSDYHGEGARRAEYFGVTNLPRHHYDAFVARAGAMALARLPGRAS